MYYVYVNVFKIGYMYFSEMNVSSKIYYVEYMRSKFAIYATM